MSFKAVKVVSSMPYWLAFSYVKSKIGPASMACFFLYSGESGLSSGRGAPAGPAGGVAAIVDLRLAASAAVNPFALAGDIAPPFMPQEGVVVIGLAFGVS